MGIYICIYKNIITKDIAYLVCLEILLGLRKHLFLSEQSAVLTKISESNSVLSLPALGCSVMSVQDIY